MKKAKTLWLLLVFVLTAAAAAAPFTFSDNFDKPDWNKNGAWIVAGDPSATATVVDKTVCEPLSPPNCLKLTDDSQAASIQISKEFGPATKGVLKFAVNVPTAGPGDFYATLNSGEDRIVDISFSISANLKYRDAADKQQTIGKYTPAAWHKVEIGWDAANKMASLSVDGAKKGDYPFMKPSAPNKVIFKVGSSAKGKTGQNAYLDDVAISAE